MLNQYNEERLRETAGIERSDKGHHRINDYWQNYIQEVYEKSLKDKRPLKPADVVREVQRHAVIDLRHEEGDYPHPATVYRILKPLIERQKRRQKIRNPGSGSWLAVETRDGKLLKAEFSNQVIQCDHTKLDIRIIDKDGKLLPWRPWLTAVVDTFSSCVIGYHLWHKQPGSHEVALTLRHAILPKRYPPEYELTETCNETCNIYGAPLQYFFTDGGKDLSKSKLIKAIGKKLGFQCELRDRPIQGGIQERLFKTINTEVLEPLPENLTYRCEELRSLQGEYVTLKYDPDHVLTLYVYRQATGDEAGEFIDHAHAINMDVQDLSLDELKQLNKGRSNAKRSHSNYDALLALDRRDKRVEQRKQEKKERQRSEQKKLRGKSKQNSNVVELRKKRAGKTASNAAEPQELLPARVPPEQMKPQAPASPPPLLETAASTPQLEERHRLVIPKNQTLKRIW